MEKMLCIIAPQKNFFSEKFWYQIRSLNPYPILVKDIIKKKKSWHLLATNYICAVMSPN